MVQFNFSFKKKSKSKRVNLITNTTEIAHGNYGEVKHPYGYYWRYCDSQGNILDNGYGNKKE